MPSLSPRSLVVLPILAVSLATFAGCNAAPAPVEERGSTESAIAPLVVVGYIVAAAAVVDSACDGLDAAAGLKVMAEWTCANGRGEGTQDVCNLVESIDNIAEDEAFRQAYEAKELVCNVAATVPGKGWVKRVAKYLGEEAAKGLARKIWKDMQVNTCNEPYLEECGGGEGVCCDSICIEPQRLNGVNPRCYNEYFGKGQEQSDPDAWSE